jgi:metal-dependent amidase/aminoacylase/carboxypeptidase family protein
MSDDLWKHPELAMEEHKAHDLLTGLLRDHGFQVDEHYTVETAFRARAGGDQGINVAIICEYDALPEIGHACGHNLIAEAATVWYIELDWRWIYVWRLIKMCQNFFMSMVVVLRASGLDVYQH